MEIISAWELYLWTRLDTFNGAGMEVLIIFSGMLYAFYPYYT